MEMHIQRILALPTKEKLAKMQFFFLERLFLLFYIVIVIKQTISVNFILFHRAFVLPIIIVIFFLTIALFILFLSVGGFFYANHSAT